MNRTGRGSLCAVVLDTRTRDGRGWIDGREGDSTDVFVLGVIRKKLLPGIKGLRKTIRVVSGNIEAMRMVPTHLEIVGRDAPKVVRDVVRLEAAGDEGPRRVYARPLSQHHPGQRGKARARPERAEGGGST